MKVNRPASDRQLSWADICLEEGVYKEVANVDTGNRIIVIKTSKADGPVVFSWCPRLNEISTVSPLWRMCTFHKTNATVNFSINE